LLGTSFNAKESISLEISEEIDKKREEETMILEARIANIKANYNKKM